MGLRGNSIRQGRASDALQRDDEPGVAGLPENPPCTVPFEVEEGAAHPEPGRIQWVDRAVAALDPRDTRVAERQPVVNRS
jgi:hypothetical protein